MHKVRIRQQLLNEPRLLGSLLSELGETARRGFKQDDELHQLGIQRVAGQEFLQDIRFDFRLGLLVWSDLGRLIGTNLADLIRFRRPSLQRVADQQFLDGIGLTVGLDRGFVVRLDLFPRRNLRREFGAKLVELVGIPRLQLLANLGERRWRCRLLCANA